MGLQVVPEAILNRVVYRCGSIRLDSLTKGKTGVTCNRCPVSDPKLDSHQGRLHLFNILLFVAHARL